VDFQQLIGGTAPPGMPAISSPHRRWSRSLENMRDAGFSPPSFDNVTTPFDNGPQCFAKSFAPNESSTSYNSTMFLSTKLLGVAVRSCARIPKSVMSAGGPGINRVSLARLRAAPIASSR
jgi:hypothetical protein